VRIFHSMANSTATEDLVLFQGRVATPFAKTVAVSDLRPFFPVTVTVSDPKATGLTLSGFSARATKQPYDASRFKAVFHFAGDSFAGLGAWNDLASAADRAQFV